jgi:O-antigen/teichoic acid export membrane protein
MTTVRRALVWSLSERYASLVITIATTLILARLLTPTQIGIFSMCAAVTTVAGILRDFGVSEYLIQEKDLTEAKIKSALGIALVIAWSIGGIVFLSRNSIASFYNENGLADVLAVLSLNFVILPFASPSFALLNREMAFRKIFLVQITSNTFQSVTALLLAFKGYGYMSLAWAPVVGILAQTLLLGYFRPSGTLLLPSLKGARSVLSYGSMFATSRVIETFSRNAHEFFLARQFGFASVGLFSRAFGLIELFHANIAGAILRVATPSFAADHRDGLQLAKTYARGTAIFTAVAWPFFAFVAFMSAEIVMVLFGPQWNAAAPIATILALTFMPIYLYALAPNLLAATGHIKTRLKISLIFSPIHISGVFFAAFVSMEAVASVWFFTNFLMLGLYAYHLRSILNATARELFLPSLGSFYVACTSSIAQFMALIGCKAMGVPTLLLLILVAFSGAVAWILAIWVLKHPVYDEISKYFPRRFTSR